MNNAKKYFDLHTRGLGYVNRLRTVTPKKGSPFLACTIAALRGNADDCEYTYIDVRVYNETAMSLLESCTEALAKKQKVLIAFNIGDIYPDVFTYESGPKKGQSGCSIKGRLIKISMLRIDRHEFYRDTPETPESLPQAS